MNEFEKIIEDIRATILSESDPAESWLKELEERYRTAVSDANQRLRQCDELMNLGHRAEALQRAEVVPKLLDLVAILDFSEHSHWSEYLKAYGLDAAPTVDLSVAEELNAAYNEEASVEELMRRHRLHALRRSPLQTRLAIIRQLADRQQGNPIWQEDLPAYEETRHRQILQEVKELKKSVEKAENLSQMAQRDWESRLGTGGDSDGIAQRPEVPAAASGLKKVAEAKAHVITVINSAVEHLAKLESEVRSEVWRRPPPEPTRQKVIELHTHLRSKRAMVRLEQLGEELIAAHNGWDVDHARKLREQWKAQARIAQIQADHPQWKHIEPALNWLQQQDESEEAENRFQEALASLEYALDHHLSRAEIEKRRYKLQSMDRDIPRALEIRVDEKLEALDVASRRKSRLIFATSVAAIILVGIGIGFLIYARARSDTKKQYVAALSDYVQNSEYEKAVKLISDLGQQDPAIGSSIEIQELVMEMKIQVAAEEQRASEFQALVHAAQEEGQDWQMHGNALAKLNRADQMAIDDQERNTVRNVRDAVNRTYDSEKRKRESGRRTEFEQLFAEFSEMESQKSADLERISQLKTQLEVFENSPFVPEDVKSNVHSVLDRLNAIRTTELTQRSHGQALDKLWAASVSRARFESQIKQYAAQYQGKRPLVAALQKLVKEESPIWDGLEQRNTFVKKWSGVAYQAFTPQQVQEYLADSRALIDQHADLPGVSRAQEMADVLVRIENRYESDGRPKYDILQDLIAENSNLNVAIVLDEERIYRHYFDGDETPKPSVDGQRRKVYAFVDDQFQDTEQVLFQPSARVAVDTDRDSYVSPMSRFMRRLDENLNQEMLWEARFNSLVISLEAEWGMEPIRKVRLLAEILEIGCKGSQPFTAVYGKDLELIRRSRFNYRTSRWVDSSDKEIRQDRRSAVNLLHNLGFRTLEGTLEKSTVTESNAPLQRLERLRSELQKVASIELGPVYVWCSCLRNDEQAGWQLARQLDSSLGDTVLVTFHRLDGTVQASQIGTFVGGKVQIEQNAGAALKQGRPVFAQRSL